MQQNKKYLIITIWISAISFIAAGMLGWGAYNFSSSQNAVAKVGKINISFNELNLEYQNILNNYEEKQGKTLDKEQADMLGVENIAIQMLINQALLENFALDSGLRISNEEVSKQISNTSSFQKNGVFDTELYKEILKQNRIKPLEYEEMVRKKLLVQKISSAFPAIATPLEKDVMSLPINLQDKLSIQIIYSKDIKVNITDSELKEFYEKNKESYKEDKSFEVEMIKYNIDDINANEDDIKAYYEQNQQNYTNNGVRKSFDEIKEQIKDDYKNWRAKRNALETSVKLRDSKIEGKKTIISQKDNKELINAIQNIGNKIEPILLDKTYWIVKVIKENPQEIKEFSSVKEQVKNDYYPKAQREAMIKEAKSRLNVFKGNNIGFYGINSQKTIPNLNQLESQQVIAEIFNKNDKNGYVILGNKVILYNILEQKVLKNDYNARILDNFKTMILEQSMFEFLSQKYKIINNLKKDS